MKSVIPWSRCVRARNLQDEWMDNMLVACKPGEVRTLCNPFAQCMVPELYIFGMLVYARRERLKGHSIR